MSVLHSRDDDLHLPRSAIRSAVQQGIAWSAKWGVASCAICGQGGAVTQHKCGTCRYFEEGDFAGSGRCDHPSRKNIQQMVLVRKSELACRTDWADDLWEPKVGSAPVPLVSAPRLNPDSRGNDDKLQYTDRVTAVGVSTMPTDSATSTERYSAQAGVSDVRHESPVERHATAHDQHEDQRRTSTNPMPREVKREYQAPPVDRRKPSIGQSPTPNEPSNWVASRPTRTTSDREDPDINLPRPTSLSDVLGDRRSSVPSFTPPATSPSSPNSRPRGTASDPRIADRRPQSDDWSQRRDEPSSAQLADNRHVNAPAAAKPTFGSIPNQYPQSETISQGRSGWTEPFNVAQPAQDGVAPSATPIDPQEDLSVVAQPVVPSYTTGSARQPTLRECCGTCRDFRPIEGGERGWCNNQYAFDQRRMVERNDLACRGTIGSWWVAGDDWWLQRADIAHHGRPTPIVDDLLRQMLDSRGPNPVRR